MHAAYWISLVMCLAPGFCSAQKPKPCRVPDMYTGAMILSSKGEFHGVDAYSYDAINKRIRLQGIRFLNNETVSYDGLLLYKKRIMYKINPDDQTCVKTKLKSKFHPMEVPKGAVFLAPVVLGTSSSPGQGLVVNTFLGLMPNGSYLMTVTNDLCLPVSMVVHDDKRQMSLSFFDNMLGADPIDFIPPPFCKDAKLDAMDGIADFFSIFN
ncbi:ependymin-1-like [Sardina pilchardus]|uniref:ependymin-1-like n=1 Tax=Sardina pilchardus TaxID=27697 RepID=UPI002E0E54F9